MKRFALVMLVLVGCPPANGPGDADASPPFDASIDGCDSAATCSCARLCELGCPECVDNCAPSVAKIIASRITRFDPSCVIASQSKADVRRCPAIVCE